MDEDTRDILDGSQFATGNDNGAIIKVIGIGGGGGNAVNFMYKEKIRHINFVVCNTDKQALEMSPVETKVLLGKEITHGRGAGNKPEIGRQCAEASVEELKSLFNDETEMVFITAGMGGGTGTGAAPVVARIAKEAGMLTIGIVTVPFMFEGESKIIKALEGADELRKHVDALLMINNENLIDLYKDLNLFNAFSKADDTLANAARSISEIISEPCYVNVDFQDVKTTLKDSGSAIIATAIGEGEHRITNAIKGALHSPLLKAHDINTSKRLLLKFICAKDSDNPIRTEEMGEITAFTSKLPASVDVKWGIGDNPEMGDKVKVTVLASGFDVTIGEGKKIIIDNNDENNNGTINMGPKPDSKLPENTEKTIADVYGPDKIRTQKIESMKLKYAVLKPSQMDDHDVIAQIERVPAFNRPSEFNMLLEHINDPASDPAPDPRQEQRSGNKISF